jgi:AcrR family transcriptional regulator
VGQKVRSRARGEATRTAILAAARERFASDGYERATIRAIAADAGVDPAMVMRHFGSKERLFASAASFDLQLPDLSALPRSRLGAGLVAHFLERWEGDDTLKALLRAAVSNKAAAARLRGILDKQLVTALIPLFPNRAVAASRAGLVASQMLGLAMTRYLLRLPPVVALDRAAVIEWLGPTIQRYVGEAGKRGGGEAGTRGGR